MVKDRVLVNTDDPTRPVVFGLSGPGWHEDGPHPCLGLRNGAPYVAEAALQAETSPPDYTAIRASALGVYHVPRQVEDTFYGQVTPPAECLSEFQRYIYDGIAQFAEEMTDAKIVALQDTQHNIHLVSPDELEAVMKAWLENLRGRN